MTLPASFPLSVSQIRTEYGLSGPVSLRTFVGQSGFPSSGPISMSNFLGKSAGSTLAAFISGAPFGSRLNAGSVTTSAATASATGGTPGYTYAWTYVSGDALTIDSPSSASTTFSTTLTSGQTKNSVYRCTVTDSVSATATADVSVNVVSTVLALTMSPDPSDVSGFRVGAGSITSDTTTGGAVGGTPGYTYAWTRVSGDVFTIDTPSATSTSFSATLPADVLQQGVYRLTVTDAALATVFSEITVQLEATI